MSALLVDTQSAPYTDSMSLLPRQVVVLLTGILTAGALAIYGTTKGCDFTRDGLCFVRKPGAGGFALATDTSSRFYVAAIVVALIALVGAASPWARVAASPRTRRPGGWDGWTDLTFWVLLPVIFVAVLSGAAWAASYVGLVAWWAQQGWNEFLAAILGMVGSGLISLWITFFLIESDS